MAADAFAARNIDVDPPDEGVEYREYHEGQHVGRIAIYIPDTGQPAGVREAQAGTAARKHLGGGTVVNIWPFRFRDGWYEVRLTGVPDDAGYAVGQEPF